MAALEFLLDPADLPGLLKWGGIRAGRTFPASIVWHDMADGALARKGRCLAAAGPQWQLADIEPATAISVPPIHAEARRAAFLDPAVLGGTPADLAPCAGFSGHRRTLRWTDGQNEVVLHVLNGQFQRPGQRRPAKALCRITLDGTAGALPPLAIAIAQDLRLTVPHWGFAEEALAAAHGARPPPRALGAPTIVENQVVTDSLVTITGHLLDVMVHWSGQLATARSPEAVHQMRVATRRLRSALSVFKPAAACPDLVALSVTLKLCAARLGTAREWDAFIGGLGAQLAEAFPDDPRCAAMLRAAIRRRREAYKELRSFLDGPDFHTMTVALACAATLRPWEGTAPAEGLQQDTARFASTVLAKRMKRVRHAGRGIEVLSVPALHELRKDCKKLRYAAEFFVLLFSSKKTKRFLTQLSKLQEELGLLNDSAAVSGLMAQLGRLERSYAAGLVEGFSAAHAESARDRIELAWKRFKRAPTFW